MVQEAVLAPTPMPPSINTNSQSHTNDEETEEIMFSEANTRASQAQQQRQSVMSDIVFSEVPQTQQQRESVMTDIVFSEVPQGNTTPPPPNFLHSASDNETRPPQLSATSPPEIHEVNAPPSSNESPSFQIEDDHASAAEEEVEEDDHDEQRNAAPQSYPIEKEADVIAPPVPQTRGPGHTPRGARPNSTNPPQRPPSRTSSRFGTPRVSHADIRPPQQEEPRAPTLIPEEAVAAAAPPASMMPRPSVAQSDRSIAFQVEDELSSAASVNFEVVPSAVNRRRSDASADPATATTEGSEIHFNVVPETQVSRGTKQRSASAAVEPSVDPPTNTETSDIHFNVEPSRTSRMPANGGREGTTSTTSLQFEIESTAEHTRHSSISHFTVENDEPQPHLQPEDEGEAVEPQHVVDAAQPVADVHDPEAEAEVSPVPEEIVTESEARRREQKAEDERRKKALAERSDYMNVRPWDANAPNPRARRTSSQAAAHARDQQEAEKRDSAAKRRQDMYARPWRTGMSTTPRKQRSTSAAKSQPAKAEAQPQEDHARPWRTHMATSPKKAEPVEVTPKDPHPWRHGMATTPKKKRTATPTAVAAAHNEEKAQQQRQQRQQQQRSVKPTTPESVSSSPPPSSSSSSADLSVEPSPQEVTPLVPPKPVFDVEEAAKFISPPPVLKAPLQVLGDEFENWSEIASQQRNLQAILEEMRTRERSCARLASQLEAQEGTLKRLNKELYATRDAFVRRHGTDVTGMPLRAPREADQADTTAAGNAATAGNAEDAMLLRLYPRPAHQATDYLALKQQRSGGPVVSVLSDDDMSDGERQDFAQELTNWKAERHALRKERARLARERRDLAFQTRRGSNIKDIKLTQPTSARGPLDRRAYGTETMVDIDGYDKLMDLRIAAQKADVEAANARDKYESVNQMAATMRKQQRSDTRELTDAQEMQAEAKERYEKILKEIHQRIEEARPVIDKAQATLRQRERAALRFDDDDAAEHTQAELREYSDNILAVRLQVDRAAAMADAAGGDEERMRRASTPRAGGMSRTASPRGSISVSARPGMTPRGRANSTSSNNNNDVFARLAGRKSVDAQYAGSRTPKEASAAAA